MSHADRLASCAWLIAHASIECDGQPAMVHSLKHGYYMFPEAAAALMIWVERDVKVLEMLMAEKDKQQISRVL